MTIYRNIKDRKLYMLSHFNPPRMTGSWVEAKPLFGNGKWKEANPKDFVAVAHR